MTSNHSENGNAASNIPFTFQCNIFTQVVTPFFMADKNLNMIQCTLFKVAQRKYSCRLVPVRAVGEKGTLDWCLKTWSRRGTVHWGLKTSSRRGTLYWGFMSNKRSRALIKQSSFMVDNLWVWWSWEKEVAAAAYHHHGLKKINIYIPWLPWCREEAVLF